MKCFFRNGVACYCAIFTLLFLLPASAVYSQTNLVRAEYFIDTDPGFGQGISIPVNPGAIISDQSVTVNLNGVAAGLHNLFVRTCDANGNWSISNRSSFYKANATASLANIVKAEYFIDTDPGFGQGLNIAINAGASLQDITVPVSLAGVSAGLHNLFLRTLDANGNWSISNRSSFYKAGASASIPNIVKAEYFIDTDPGFGQAINIAVNAGTSLQDITVPVNLAGVSTGLHNLYLRTLDANGNWSISNRSSFYKAGVTASLPNIIKAEYFIDTDPGFGQAVNIVVNAGTSLQDITVPVNLTAINEGMHNLFIRTLDANGNWSISNRSSFFRSPANPVLPSIVKAEYFIDTDPGFGLAVSVPLPASSNIANQNVNVDLAGITAGFHRFYLRSLDANGKWSITATDTFSISSTLVPAVTIGSIVNSFCAGSTIRVPFTVNTPFGAGNIFTAQLSDADGNFGTPVNIGTLSAINSDSILCTVPSNIAAGSNYRIRMLSTSPIATSPVGGDQLTVLNIPGRAFAIAGATSTCIGVQPYHISVTEQGAGYNWQLNAGGSLTTSGATASVNWTTAGSHTITAASNNSCGTGQPVNLVVQVYAAAPVITPSISVNNRILTAAQAGIAQSVSGYQWYKDGVAITGQTAQSYTVPDAETGSYTVAYTNGCGIGQTSAPAVINIVRNNQIIVFIPVAVKTFGDPAFEVSASASSGLPVTYSIVNGPGAMNEDTVTITGGGVITVRAFQEGNNSFNPAEAFLNITVNKLRAELLLNNMVKTYSGAAQSATAVTIPAGLAVSITYNGSSALPVNAGNYATAASINSADYSGSKDSVFVINKADQAISLQDIPDKGFNDAAFSVIALSNAGLPVVISIVTIPASGVAAINGNIITILGAGTVTVTATQAGNINYNAATASTSFTITPPTAKDIEVAAITSPASSCGLGDTASITIRLRNAGTIPATGIPVSYSINGGAVITDTIRSTIASGTDLLFTFATIGDFPVTGQSYQLQITASLPDDERNSNDTLLRSFARYAPVVSGVSADTSICTGGTAILKAFGGSSYTWAGGPSAVSYSVSPLVSTTYTVMIADVNGCANSSASVQVTVLPLPVVNAGADVAMLRGSSITLTGTGEGALSWSTGAATAQTIVSPQTTATYTLTATAANGCKANDDVLVTVNFSAINVQPSVLDMGNVVKDSASVKFVVVTNTGTLPETIDSITGLLDPFGSSFALPLTLPAGTSVSIPFRFIPDALLFYQNQCVLNTTAGNFNITLSGKGVVAAPAWMVVPSYYDFGRVERNTNITKRFAVTNTGNIPIRISLLSSSSPRFVPAVNGNINIPVGASVPLDIRFNPTAVDSYNGFITIRTSTTDLSLTRVIVAGEGYINGNPPVLNFVSQSPFNGEGGVFPAVGSPGAYTYSVVYSHPDSIEPRAGFPKIGIDKNNDGDCIDPGEGIYSMVKQGTANTWRSGVTYTFTTSLALNNTYGNQFYATDVLGNVAVNSLYSPGPIVTRETLDLHIFASDISFSNTNPAVNQTFTTTATVHNNSPYSAADVEVRWYYKDSIYFSKDTIPFIDANSSVSLTKEMAFAPDGFYAIKVWIDTLRQLGETNILNNYASRPVIVGTFTVPGVIDITANAAPSVCNKGKTNFYGKANYRGLNLAGTPPVEGATITLKIYSPVEQTFILNTDIKGDWFFRWDPCALEGEPEGCEGPACGVPYTYTVEVTDFTLTSPLLEQTFTIPCVSCIREGDIRHFGNPSGCILENEFFTYTQSIENFIYDEQNNKLCAPTVYRDTIEVYRNGQLWARHTLDSIVTCTAVSFTDTITGLPVGQHSMSYTHTYYTAAGERRETTVNSFFEVLRAITDLSLEGISRTGLKSFAFSDVIKVCGVPAGPHVVYLYDSVPGYGNKLLIDSFVVNYVPAPFGKVYLSYDNPDWQIGYHYLTIITDVRNTVTELNENNNVLEAVFYVQEPDITISGIRNSNTALVAGSLVNFTANVYNRGSAVRDPFKVEFKVNGVPLGTKINVPAINNEQTIVVVSAPYVVPANPCPVQVSAFADVDLVIQEFREDNNADTVQLGVNINAGRSCGNDEIDPTGAGFFNEDDFLGTSECTPYTVLKGVRSYFATTVRNNGNRDARNIRVQFKLNGQVLGTDLIASLNAGEFVASGFFHTFDTAGRFIVNAFADYTREICEINETDNIGNIHIDTRPTLGDLQILSQHIAPSNLNPDPGQSISIVSSILNIGDAPVGPTRVRFWVNDVQLGSDIQLDTIFAGQDTTVMADENYSSSIVGLKVIKVTADVLGKQPERRESNNEATRSIIVGAAPDFANSLNEAITLSPAFFGPGDSVTICNYIRNYGGDGGTAWMRFYYRRADGEKVLLDSVQFTMNENDSFRVCGRFLIPEAVKQIITEIDHSSPPEFNVLNNIDSLLIGNVIPVTLISFNGSIKNKMAWLQWKTAQEINLSHFELQRSVDGRIFQSIGYVSASNRAGVMQYQYTDSSFMLLPAEGIYYRLKITDMDGTYRYSQVVQLSKQPVKDQMEVYPNPVKNILTAKVTAASNYSCTLLVLDAAGKKLVQQQVMVQQGVQAIPVEVSRFAKGLYLLQLLRADGTVMQIKFVKE